MKQLFKARELCSRVDRHGWPREGAVFLGTLRIRMGSLTRARILEQPDP